MERSSANRNAVGQLYDRSLGHILSSSRLIGVLGCVALNGIVYWCTQALAANRTLYDMTTALDRMIPFDPRWVVVYVACFAYWAVSYVLMAKQDNWYPIMTGEVLAKLLCGVFFLLIPTTNVRPEITGTGPTDWLMSLIYQLDPPLDLFPSIHCMESWICFRGMLGQKKIPKWYQIFAGIFTFLVCLSTLFTRQHVIADVIGGVLLGEICLDVSRHRGWGKRLRRWAEAIDKKLFG